MAYIGNVPAEKYASLTRQTFSSPTGTSHTLSYSVTNSDDLLLYINNVKQDPADYTASGTSLTTPTLVSGDEMYALFYGRATETVNPPDDSVGLSQMAGGTDGNLITFDASGNPAYVATGSSGQVLTSAGAGAPPTFSAAPSHTGNVAFPATQVASADANTLDDYEETTWTCTLTDGSNDATGTATGTATKVGRLVVASAYLQTSSLGSVSGSIQMKGLPYTSANDGKYHSCAIGYGQGWAYTAGYMVSVHLPPNSTTMDMYVFDTAAGATGFQSGEWSDNGQMMITVSYTSA
jgi:hypothetical protein